jgi:threonine/homoserine/homoserine lactone efflux protein
MIESFFTLSIIGLLAGILFSIPIWGPVSIFIATNGLRGRWGFCVAVALGSGIVDALVCFIVLMGFVKVLGIISPFIPYLFLCGAAVLFFTGVRTIKTKIGSFQTRDILKKRVIAKNINGFWKGFLLNASNPSILFGWLSSSFLAISFAASLGLNVGSFDRSIGETMHTFKIFSTHLHNPNDKSMMAAASKGPSALPILPVKKDFPDPLPLLAGAGYAFSTGLGTFIWFSSFSYVLARYRTRFPMVILGKVIQGLGIMLCVLALYFLVRAVKLLMIPLFPN